MKIALGADHAGFALKSALKGLLQQAGYVCVDLGAFSDSPSDYPDFAVLVARAVASGECHFGIVICGTGIGSQMAAGKVPGIRAALCHDEFTARLSRSHNDANVLCLGGRVLAPDLAWRVVQVWLETPFSGDERHSRRLRKLARLEESLIRSSDG